MINPIRGNASVHAAVLTVLAASGFTFTDVVHAQTTGPNRGSDATSGSDQLEEVIVTAERRQADVQKTATSVSVRSGDDLRREGRNTLQQFLEDIPGVTISDLDVGGAGTDSKGNNIVIRGAVPNGGSPGSTISVVPSTAVYTDGVYEGIGGTYDIDRIEVLRGPQGTLYGRSATSGVVSTYTRNPKLDTYNADVALEIGSYALRHAQAAVNLPLGDVVALRVSGDQIQRDGYWSAEGGKVESTQGRAKFLFQPNDAFSLLLGAAVEYNERNTGGISVGQPTPNNFIFVPTRIGASEDHYKQYWANLTWDFGPATLTYMPAFRSWYMDTSNFVIDVAGTVQNLKVRPLDEFVTHEIHLTSDPGSKLTWQVGTLYYDNQLRDSIDVRIVGAGLVYNDQTRKRTQDWGIFAEGTYPFTDALRLTIGGRYDHTSIQDEETRLTNATQGGIPENVSALTVGGPDGEFNFYNATYKLRLEADLSPTNLLFASVSTGFLPGDVTLSTAPAPGPPGTLVGKVFPYSEETLTAYEIGSKNRFFDNSLQINAGIYYYVYDGYQEIIDTSPSFPPSFATVLVPARMRGLELEALYQLTPNDRIGFNYGYVHAEFVDAPDVFENSVAQSRITGVTPVTGSANYDHEFHLPGGSTLNFHGSARYASGHDVATVKPQQAATSKPYVYVGGEWVGDLSLGWLSESERYSVNAYVRNIADNQYKTAATGPGSGSPINVASLSDPRTWGVKVSASF